MVKNMNNKNQRLTTGCKTIDSILQGGLTKGTITSISGESSTGKTQIAFQTAMLASNENKRVLFIDTCGTFRPERIISMCKARKLDHEAILKKIMVIRINEFEEQIKIIGQSIRINRANKFKVLIIDTLTGTLADLSTNIQEANRISAKIALHLNDLSHLASELDIYMLITNGIRESFRTNDNKSEAGGAAVSQGIHFQVRLGLDGNKTYAENIYPSFTRKRVNYRIKNEGIVDE